MNRHWIIRNGFDGSFLSNQFFSSEEAAIAFMEEKKITGGGIAEEVIVLGVNEINEMRALKDPALEHLNLHLTSGD